jgi:hypothetical protein
MAILQSTQFDIKKLAITNRDGSKGFDIKSVFEELSIFDNIMMPCMSGNIVIKDAVGLASKINFDGTEYLEIDIIKDLQNSDSMFFKKRFVIYKLTDRKELTQRSEIYTLHFVSEEFVLSEQKKLKQSYKGTYYDMVVKILSDHLKVPFETILDGNRSGIANMEPTKGLHTYVVPNLTPFQAIEYISKVAINNSGTPDYLFWQTQLGYNFMSLSTLLSYDAFYDITVGVKNIAQQSGGENIESEIYGARDLKVISQFNMAENVKSGVYAGKFIGFDPLTRTVTTQNMSFDNVYNLTKNHANDVSMNTGIFNKEGKVATEMYDSRVTLFPFQEDRKTNSYLKSKDNKSSTIIQDTHNYILQRRIIFANLMQKRLRLTMPGNFALASGNNANIEVPHRYVEENKSDMVDTTLSGKYIITGVRHIIRFDKHETIIEVATDSSMKKEI